MSPRFWLFWMAALSACPPSLRIEGADCFRDECPTGFRCVAFVCTSTPAAGGGGGATGGGAAGGGGGPTGGGGVTGGGASGGGVPTGGGGGSPADGGGEPWVDCKSRPSSDGGFPWVGILEATELPTDGGLLVFQLPFTSGELVVADFEVGGAHEFLIRNGLCLELLRVNGRRVETAGAFNLGAVPTRFVPFQLDTGNLELLVLDAAGLTVNRLAADAGGLIELATLSTDPITDLTVFRRPGQQVDSLVTAYSPPTRQDFSFWTNDAGTLNEEAPRATLALTCAAEENVDDPVVVMGTSADLVALRFLGDGGLTGPLTNPPGAVHLVSVGRHQGDAGHFVGAFEDGGVQMVRVADAITPVQLTATTGSLAPVADFVAGHFGGDPDGGWSIFVSNPTGVSRWRLEFVDTTRANVVVSPFLPAAGQTNFGRGRVSPDDLTDLVITQTDPARLFLLLSE